MGVGTETSYVLVSIKAIIKDPYLLWCQRLKPFSLAERVWKGHAWISPGNGGGSLNTELIFFGEWSGPLSASLSSGVVMGLCSEWFLFNFPV